MFADLPLRNNLNLRFHHQRSQCVLDDCLTVKRDQRFRLAQQTLRGVQLNRCVNKQGRINGEPRDQVIVLYQFLTS